MHPVLNADRLKPSRISSLNAIGIPQVHLSGLEIMGPSTFSYMKDSVLANSLIRSTLHAQSNDHVMIAHNNVFGGSGGAHLTMEDCEDSYLQHNIIMGTDHGPVVTVLGDGTTSDYNNYWPFRDATSLDDGAADTLDHTGYYASSFYGKPTPYQFLYDPGNDEIGLGVFGVGDDISEVARADRHEEDWYRMHQVGPLTMCPTHPSQALAPSI